MSTTLRRNTICQFKDLILIAQNDLNLKAREKKNQLKVLNAISQ